MMLTMQQYYTSNSAVSNINSSQSNMNTQTTATNNSSDNGNIGGNDNGTGGSGNNNGNPTNIEQLIQYLQNLINNNQPPNQLEFTQDDKKNYQILFKNGPIGIVIERNLYIAGCYKLTIETELNSLCQLIDLKNKNKIKIYDYNQSDITFAGDENGNDLFIIFSLKKQTDQNSIFSKEDSLIVIHGFFNIESNENTIILYFKDGTYLNTNLIRDKFGRSVKDIWNGIYSLSYKNISSQMRLTGN